MYKIEYENHFHPNISNNKKKYMFSHGRGLPCVCRIKNNIAHFTFFNNLQYLKINGFLIHTYVKDIETLKILSATSSYFGALGDRSMKKFLTQKNLFTFKFLQFFSFPIEDNYKDFTTSIPINDINVRFADGCLWDCYGLHSVFLGLKEDKLLNNPLILVFTYDVFANNEWWEKNNKYQTYCPNSSIFKGNINNNFKFSKMWSNIAYVNTYENCEIHEKNTFNNWYDNGTLIDIIVIGIIQPKGISTIPTDSNDRKYFKKYESRIKKYLPIIFDDIKLNDRIRKKKSVSICFSGGGCKTALLAMYSLHELQKMYVLPKIIVGTSGGAWGIYMYYKYYKYTTNFTDVLLSNCKILKKHIDIVSLKTIQNLESASELSVFTSIIPILSKMNVKWETIVNIIINGNTQEHLDWKIFPSNLQVLVPISLLCDSSFGKN